MLGNRLKKIRKEKKLSQKAFADPLSTSSGYISEIEQGKKIPGSEFLVSLSRVYDVSIDWLLTGIGDTYLNGKNKDLVYGNDGKEVNVAIDIAREILISNSELSSVLSAIIFSLHLAITGEEKHKALEKQLEKVGCKHLVSIDEARIRHDDPPQEKKEILKKRAI